MTQYGVISDIVYFGKISNCIFSSIDEKILEIKPCFKSSKLD